MDGHYPHALVLHFKGKRKPHLFPYWHRHISEKSKKLSYELIPHIDIIEPERIRALQEDPRNFTWRAVDSETLDS